MSYIVNITTASAGSMQLVETVTVSGSNANTISFTGLDLDTDGYYVLVCNHDYGSGTGTATIYMEINGDTTQANYYTQNLILTDTTSSPSRTNNCRAYAIGDGKTAMAVIWIHRDNQGYATMICNSIRDPGSAVRREEGFMSTSGAISNITSITLVSSQSNNFKIGSVFSLYKVGKS